MPIQEGQSGSEAFKLQRTFRKRGSMYSVPDAPLKQRATDREEDPIGFARAGSNPKSSDYNIPAVAGAHHLRDHRAFENLASNSSKSFTVQSRSEKHDRRHSTTRWPTSTANYSAPGSTKQLATFCEQERARFFSAKSAKAEEPLKWAASPACRRGLGLSVVFAAVSSLLSRLWSALVLFCRKRACPGKLEAAMISVGTMPSEDVPRTLSPLTNSGDGTPTHKYPVSMEEFSTQASSTGPPQSGRSRSKRDMRAAISSTPQYPRSRFEVSEQVFTRAVSAEPLPSSTNSDAWRNRNATLDEKQRRPTIPSSHTSKKSIYIRPDHGVSYRQM